MAGEINACRRWNIPKKQNSQENKRQEPNSSNSRLGTLKENCQEHEETGGQLKHAAIFDNESTHQYGGQKSDPKFSPIYKEETKLNKLHFYAMKGSGKFLSYLVFRG